MQSLLVVYCGLPGVGKSTVSRYTAEQLDAARYRSDEVRQDLFDEPEYTEQETRTTYEALLERARSDLEAGQDVVVDATFNQAGERDRAAAVAERAGAAVEFVRVVCPPEIVRERIRARTGDASEANLEVYREHRETFEPLEREHVTIDNSGTLEESREQVDRRVLADRTPG